VSPWDSRLGLAFVNILERDGNPYMLCPRQLLQKSVNELKSLGYEIKAGIEIEFMLFKEGTADPLEKNHYLCLSSTLDMEESFLDINDWLAKLGVEVECIHKESYPG